MSFDPRKNKYYVVLDDDETWSTDGYIVLDASLTKEQREDVHKSDAKIFKYEGVPFISIDELIDTLDKAGLWATIVEELTQGNHADEPISTSDDIPCILCSTWHADEVGACPALVESTKGDNNANG